MKKAKKSDINILIMLIGVLIAVAAYFFVYTSFKDKTAELEGQNATLESEVAELQKLADNKEFYLQETARMNDEMVAVIEKYPSDIRTEDEVMYTVELENVYSIWVNALQVEDKQMVQVAAASADQQAPENQDAVTEEAPVEDTTTDGAQDGVVATGGYQDTVFLYNSPFAINFKVTYRSMKDIVAAIVNSEERMNITNLSLAYDADTGCLSGSMNANMFTLSGTDKMYEELNVPGVSTGTADFFQSGTVLDLNKNAAVEGDAEDEESSEEDEDNTSEESPKNDD
ncbi:MAG: hypothetical protein J6K58_03885 [Lachnospiraceae bacterium]|nr:hypothetical protein [Lachnospiraceae bacterium]